MAGLLLAALLAVPQQQLDPPELGPFRACLSLPDDGEAVAWCRRALEEPLASSRAAVVLHILGLRLATLGRWDEAADAYRGWVGRQPESAAAWRRLGEALLNGTGEAPEGLAALERGLALDPGDAGAHGFRAMALNALGRYADAVRAFEDALAADPGYFTTRPAARQILAASQRGERWPPPPPEPTPGQPR